MYLYNLSIYIKVYWDMGRAMLFILYIMAMFFLLFLIKLCCAGIACAKVISVVDDKGRYIDR